MTYLNEMPPNPNTVTQGIMDTWFPTPALLRPTSTPAYLLEPLSVPTPAPKPKTVAQGIMDTWFPTPALLRPTTPPDSVFYPAPKPAPKPTPTFAPMFRADIMQPTQPGLTMQQQQSLNPVEFAQQGSEQLAAKRAAEEASEKKKTTKTLLIVGGVAAGLALLYFSLKKGK